MSDWYFRFKNNEEIVLNKIDGFEKITYCFDKDKIKTKIEIGITIEDDLLKKILDLKKEPINQALQRSFSFSKIVYSKKPLDEYIEKTTVFNNLKIDKISKLPAANGSNSVIIVLKNY